MANSALPQKSCDSRLKATPQTKKRQQTTANCVICLSSLIPKAYFLKKINMNNGKQSKINDTDKLLSGKAPLSPARSNRNLKFMDNLKERQKSSDRDTVLANPNLAQLPNCGHIFHEDCLTKWDCLSCPICRCKVDVNRRALIMQDTA